MTKKIKKHLFVEITITKGIRVPFTGVYLYSWEKKHLADFNTTPGDWYVQFPVDHSVKVVIATDKNE